MNANEIYRNVIFDICEKQGLTDHINNIYEEVMQNMKDDSEVNNTEFFKYISSEELEETVKLEMAERCLESEGIDTEEIWGIIVNRGN